MTNFQFIPVTPHPLLRPFIAKMWVFESDGRLPELEKKLIVPNANFKFAFGYRNGIVSRIGDKTYVLGENELKVSGLIDSPVILDPLEDVPTGTIGIEFHPLGAYRFFYLRYADLKNQIVDLDDLIGARAIQLRRQLAEADTVELKLQLLQRFLINQLERTSADPIYDHCVKRIADSGGLVTVGQLEKETGYSSRWLHTKFLDHLGTGPKNLSEITRFKHFYEAFSAGAKLQHLKDQIYHHYHDQSHFIRSFKRFTGSTPTELRNSLNELGTKAYRV
jgi:AraC-like DNA-binding protein